MTLTKYFNGVKINCDKFTTQRQYGSSPNMSFCRRYATAVEVWVIQNTGGKCGEYATQGEVWILQNTGESVENTQHQGYYGQFKTQVKVWRIRN